MSIVQDGSPTEQLHHVSFDMHERIAETLGVESYRKLPTMSVTPGTPGVGGNMQAAAAKPSADGVHVPWLDGAVRRCSPMDECTAQVISWLSHSVYQLMRTGVPYERQ